MSQNDIVPTHWVTFLVYLFRFCRIIISFDCTTVAYLLMPSLWVAMLLLRFLLFVLFLSFTWQKQFAILFLLFLFFTALGVRVREC